MAAAIAFYSAVSMAPLLMFLVIFAGYLWGAEDSVRAELLTYVSRVVNPRAAEFIRMVLKNANRPSASSIAGIVGIVTLFWGATNTFNHILLALNEIWEVSSDNHNGVAQLVRSRVFSFAMVLVVAFLLLVSLIFSTLLNISTPVLNQELPGTQWIWQSTNFFISLVVVMLITAAIFRILPEADISWGDVWLGAALTAVLFSLGQAGLSFFLSRVSSSYGAAGSGIAFLFWVYFSAQALLFGAEVAKASTDSRRMNEAAAARGPGLQPAPAEKTGKVKASTEPANPRTRSKM